MSDIFSKLARYSARAGGLAVLLMAFVIGIDVLSRKLFGDSILSGGAGELSGYVLAVSTAWAASLTLLHRGHIRIDILQSVVPRAAWVFFDLFAMLVFGLAAAVLAWVGVSTFLESLSRDAHSITPLAVPLAIPQGLWAAGLVFLCLTSLYLFVKALVRLVRGDRMGVVALIGTRTAEDDLREQQQVIEDIAAKGNGHA
ncbi:TRAP transporter small permease subunit [Castellaniella sp. S9]|uniref:TRAP transporter small permease subunit n=1 Tax=Castellaniella sp. S9 TaxID=2993652 RepID=UPI0022B4EACB|nr:TRAP transporter small permease [Castellaniella sp. S9]